MMNKDLAEKERIDKNVRKLWQQYRDADEQTNQTTGAKQQELIKKRDKILANISQIRKEQNNG